MDVAGLERRASAAGIDTAALREAIRLLNDARPGLSTQQLHELDVPLSPLTERHIDELLASGVAEPIAFDAVRNVAKASAIPQAAKQRARLIVDTFGDNAMSPCAPTPFILPMMSREDMSRVLLLGHRNERGANCNSASSLTPCSKHRPSLVASTALTGRSAQLLVIMAAGAWLPKQGCGRTYNSIGSGQSVSSPRENPR